MCETSEGEKEKEKEKVCSVSNIWGTVCAGEKEAAVAILIYIPNQTNKQKQKKKVFRLGGIGFSCEIYFLFI